MEGWQKHIRHTHADRVDSAWCGADLPQVEWAFLSIDHAAYEVAREGRLVPCPDCVRAVVGALGGD